MSKEEVRVQHLAAQPGSRVDGYIRVGENEDSTPIKLPISILNGAYPGKTLYVQALSDGNELNGVAVVQSILQTTDLGKLRGAIIAVPMVNITAFRHRQSASPVDGKKMNRCFPGKEKGSLSERIAWYLYNFAVKQADICIDIHQGGVGKMIDEVRVRVGAGNRCYEESLELGRVFGIGYILDRKGPDGQLARVAPADGIPTIDPELGGTHGWDQESIRKGITGMRNVLVHYGFLPGTAHIPERQVVVSRFQDVIADRGGFIHMRAELGQMLSENDLVAEITDPFGNVLERITAPCEGVLWSHKPYPMCSTGESILSIGTEVRYI